ncbi:hypothetical protein Tco_1188231 [Tanacetum coccineum]
MPDTANISDSEDTSSAHLLKIKPRLEWLKPILEEDRPATPEPAWVIPTSHIPDVVNNWANALATTYQALAENSLLEKTGDMRTFMNCSRWKSVTKCLQIRLTGLIQKVIKSGLILADLCLSVVHQVMSLFKLNSFSIKTWIICDMALRDADQLCQFPR